MVPLKAELPFLILISPICLQELLREELDAKACVINIFHFTKDFSTARGVPFKFVALLGEQIKDTRKRLQKRLVISEEVIATYRLALQVANFKQPLFLDDGEYFRRPYFQDASEFIFKMK